MTFRQKEVVTKLKIMSESKSFENHLREYKPQATSKALQSAKFSLAKPKTSHRVDHVMINKLTSELADALIEKRKCEVENDVLKIENTNYQTRVKLLVTEISSLKLMHGNNIMAIEQQVHSIQSQMQPQSNKSDDISETLKSLKNKYDENLSQVESKFNQEISTLNNAISDFKEIEFKLKKEILRLKEKYHSYKEKLKFSINVIRNLNKHITDKANNVQEIGCQTEKESCAEPVEDHLISELFFRDRPYHDDDLEFLTHKQFKEKDKETL